MTQIYIRVRTEEQAAALAKVLKNEWDGSSEVFALCPVKSDPQTADLLKKAGARVFADLPFIARENTSGELLEDMKRASWAEGYVVKNIDELGILKEQGYEGGVIGDSFLYAYNSEAAGFYREHFPGIRMMASDELTDAELERLPGGSRMIYKAYGRARVMLTAQSLVANYGEQGEAAKLRSAKNDRFISLDEDYGYTSVLTESPVSMPEAVSDGRWENVMADLTCEDRGESEKVIRAMLGKGELPSGIKGHHHKGID
ncbi:MAG: hypothetical protein E7233_10090 [Lachnospiraceae bacterium]|nr:hypothetical protein [Lachnospiraceae bacterium]